MSIAEPINIRRFTWFWLPLVVVLVNAFTFGVMAVDEKERLFLERFFWQSLVDCFLLTPLQTILIVELSLYFYRRLDRYCSWDEHPIVQVSLLFIVGLVLWLGIGTPTSQMLYGAEQLADLAFHQGFIILFVGNIGMTATIIGVSFFERWKKTAFEKEELSKQTLAAEFEALKNQLDPHFLFNSLNTLTALVEENPKNAVEFIQKFSDVYRYVLQNREKTLVPLREEIGFAKTYFYLLQQRFGENLHLELHAPKADWELGIAPMSLQMLIENAVKHNIVSREKPLTITIALERTGDEPTLVVKNDIQKKLSAERSGVGLTNIVSRYKLLAPKSLVRIDDSGNQFSVSLPLLTLS
jgi:two-component system, LytTR family, sensor kinase